MKRLIPLVFTFTLVSCRAQMNFRGASYRLIPDCGPKSCGVSYYVGYLDRQDLTEFGIEGGKLYYRHSNYPYHGTYDK